MLEQERGKHIDVLDLNQNYLGSTVPETAKKYDGPVNSFSPVCLHMGYQRL